VSVGVLTRIRICVEIYPWLAMSELVPSCFTYSSPEIRILLGGIQNVKSAHRDKIKYLVLETLDSDRTGYSLAVKLLISKRPEQVQDFMQQRILFWISEGLYSPKILNQEWKVKRLLFYRGIFIKEHLFHFINYIYYKNIL